MKPHIPLVLACALGLSAVPSFASTLTGSTTAVTDGIGAGNTYSGVIYTLQTLDPDGQFHKSTFTPYTNVNGTMTDGASQLGTDNATIDGKTQVLWNFYAQPSNNATYGHTLRVAPAAGEAVNAILSFNPAELGGLIVERADDLASGASNVKLGMETSTGSTRILRIGGNAAAGTLFSIGANTEIRFKEITVSSVATEFHVETGKKLKLETTVAGISFDNGNVTTVTGGGTLDFALAAGQNVTSAGNASLTLAEGSCARNVRLGTGMTLSTSSTGTLENFALVGGTLDFGNVAGGASLSATGTISFTDGALTIGDLDSLSAGNTYTLLNGNALAWSEASTFAGLTVNGNLVTEIDSAGVFYYTTADGNRYKGALSTGMGADSGLFLNWMEVAAQTLTWHGGTGTWSADATGWDSAVVTDGTVAFHEDDIVVFGSNASAETITIEGVVSPGEVRIEGGDYTFAAGTTGEIVSAGSLTVGAADTVANLTVNLSNASWSTQVTVNDGSTLTLAAANALGVNSTIALNGASILTLGAADAVGSGSTIALGSAATLVVSAPDTLAADTAITGTGTVSLSLGAAAAGSISSQLAGFTGALSLVNGRYNGANAPLAAGTIRVADGAQLYLTGGTWASNFEITGTGWNGNSSDPAAAGALRVDGGTIQGKVTLTGDASLMVYNTNTGTLAGAIDGAERTLTKNGAGTLNMNSSVTLGSLVVAQGTVNLNSSSVTIGSLAANAGTVTIDLGTANRVSLGSLTGNGIVRLKGTADANSLRLGTEADRLRGEFYVGNANLTLNAGAEQSIAKLTADGSSTGYIVLNGQTQGATRYIDMALDKATANQGDLVLTDTFSNKEAHIGNLTGVAGAQVRADWRGGNDIRTLVVHQTQSEAAFAGAFTEDSANNRRTALTKMGVGTTLTLSGANTTTGLLRVNEGMVLLSGSWAGEGQVDAGASLKVTGSIGSASSSNAYVVAEQGSLKVSGASGTVANSGVAVSAQAESEAELSNATVSTSGIQRTSGSGKGSIANAVLGITQTASFEIANVNLVNTLVDLRSAGAVTLNNVTVGAGTTVRNAGGGTLELSQSQLVMTRANTTVSGLADSMLSVYVAGLAGYTSISGTLTLDLTKDWVDYLVANASGNFTSIELTFSDVDTAVWDAFKANADSGLALTGALDAAMFGPPTVEFGKTGATVIITSTHNIPEPASATLGALGFAALLMRRRRRG